MNLSMLVAGFLIVTLGTAHSVLGELLIFRHLRRKELVQTMSVPPLKEQHIGILWATWHLVTVLAWAFGSILFGLALPVQEGTLHVLVKNAASIAFSSSSFLVLIGTKGKHLGWIILLAIALLVWLG